MDFYKMICFAKLYTEVMHGRGDNALSSKELDVACEVLKEMTDERQDWTKKQKEEYKALVNYVKDNSKRSRGE